MLFFTIVMIIWWALAVFTVEVLRPVMQEKKKEKLKIKI